MASGKTPMTDKVNQLRKKHGLHCATNPDGLTPPSKDASVEDRAAYTEAIRAYRSEMTVESRKFFQLAVTERTALSPAERRKSHAELRAQQLAGAKERRAANPLTP